jgi:hypothetical protein
MLRHANPLGHAVSRHLDFVPLIVLAPRTGKAGLQWSHARSGRPSLSAKDEECSADRASGNQAAHAWAGAETRLPVGRQARPDLSRDKSGKQKKTAADLRRISPASAT